MTEALLKLQTLSAHALGREASAYPIRGMLCILASNALSKDPTMSKCNASLLPIKKYFFSYLHIYI